MPGSPPVGTGPTPGEFFFELPPELLDGLMLVLGLGRLAGVVLDTTSVDGVVTAGLVDTVRAGGGGAVVVTGA